MKTILKIIAILVVLGAIAGAYMYPKYISVGASPSGTQFGTQKIAAISWIPATGSATTTSLYNSDREDRIIESSFLTCDSVGTSFTAYTGAGLAALTIRAATTTTASQAIVSNTNYAMNIASVPTTTPVMFISTSTEGVLYGYSRVWPAGTYLSFWSNATNTAKCIVGVKYIAK